jgi:hypothetical protein
MRRMKWVASVAAVAGVVISPTVAQASIEVLHEAPVACAAACAYWGVPGALSYSECENPFPEASWDQTTFAFYPTQEDPWAEITVESHLDYDSFVCTNTSPSLTVMSLSSALYEQCYGRVAGDAQTPFGCREHAILTWQVLIASVGFPPPDRSFIVRSFNWLDPGEARVTVSGQVGLVDDYAPVCVPGSLGPLPDCG